MHGIHIRIGLGISRSRCSFALLWNDWIQMDSNCRTTNPQTAASLAPATTEWLSDTFRVSATSSAWHCIISERVNVFVKHSKLRTISEKTDELEQWETKNLRNHRDIESLRFWEQHRSWTWHGQQQNRHLYTVQCRRQKERSCWMNV